MYLEELVKYVRRHAEDNYNSNGWDFLVECWSDNNIIEAMGDAKSPKEALDRISEILQLLDERRREVLNA